MTELRTKSAWKAMGFRVPTKAQPADEEVYLVPGYRTVYKARYLYSRAQVIPINLEQAEKRSNAAKRAVRSRVANMVERMKCAPLTITSGKTDDEIHALALHSHGGNYAGDPGPFHWNNHTARNAIRHCLTNYEALWTLCNRGATGSEAYDVLRARIDALVDETYPQFK